MYLYYVRAWWFGWRFRVYEQGHHQWQTKWIATFAKEIDARQFIDGGDE